MLNGRDIVVVAKLSVDPGKRTIAGFADELHMPHASVQRSLKKLEEAGLCNWKLGVAPAGPAIDLFTSGVRFLVPPRFVGQSRGVATAWSASPLKSEIRRVGEELDYVWPYQRGESYGVALEPLDRSVPQIAQESSRLWQLLALIDATRIGGAREREVADSWILRTVKGS